MKQGLFKEPPFLNVQAFDILRKEFIYILSTNRWQTL